MAADDRALRWEALLNARDLGGLPAAGAVIAHGAIVRSDALHRLNDAGRAALVAHGVRTVIDMRAPSEVSGWPYKLEDGVTVLRIPQQTEEMWATTKGLDRISNDVLMLEVARSNFARIAEAIASAPAGGVLYHCAAGKDRTGLLTMILLDLVGTPEDVIAADYALTATGLAALFADLIAKADDGARRARLEEEALCRAEVMLLIHRLFRMRSGSAESYLRGAGVSAASIDTIKRRMLDGASRTT